MEPRKKAASGAHATFRMSFKLITKKPKVTPALAAFEGSDDEEEVLRAAEEETERLKAKGIGHAEQSQWEAALNCWDRALQLIPSQGLLQELRAQALNELGRPWDAVQAASRASELLPESADVCMTLARAQLNLGEPENQEALAEIGEVQVLALRQRQLGPGTRAQVELPAGTRRV